MQNVGRRLGPESHEEAVTVLSPAVTPVDVHSEGGGAGGGRATGRAPGGETSSQLPLASALLSLRPRHRLCARHENLPEHTAGTGRIRVGSGFDELLFLLSEPRLPFTSVLEACCRRAPKSSRRP